MLDGKQLNYQRLLFCLDRENFSCMKLVLAQFKKGTKEPEYLATIQQQSFDDFEQIVPFVYRDKLFSCVSNYAYGQSQRAISSLPHKMITVGANPIVQGGGSADLIKIARKWVGLEDRVREQV